MEYPTTDLIRKIRNFRNPKTDPIREYSKYLGTGIRSDPKSYQILEIRKPIRSDFFFKSWYPKSEIRSDPKIFENFRSENRSDPKLLKILKSENRNILTERR